MKRILKAKDVQIRKLEQEPDRLRDSMASYWERFQNYRQI